MGDPKSRRRFFKALAADAAVSASGALPHPSVAQAQRPEGIRSFDHVAAPMRHTEAMVAFYRALGLQVKEGSQVCSVHFGDQKSNFHRPALWQRETFTLRAPAARPPARASTCGTRTATSWSA